MARYHLDVAALYHAVDQRRSARGMTWAQVGVETDLPGSFFTRFSYGYGPSADGLCTLLAWIGGGHECGFAKEVSSNA